MALRAFRSLSVSYASPSRPGSYARLSDQEDLVNVASPTTTTNTISSRSCTNRSARKTTTVVRLGGASSSSLYRGRERSGWRVRLQPTNYKLRLFFSARARSKAALAKASSASPSAANANWPHAAVQNFLAGPSDQMSEEEKRRRECVDILRKLSASVRRAPSFRSKDSCYTRRSQIKTSEGFTFKCIALHNL